MSLTGSITSTDFCRGRREAGKPQGALKKGARKANAPGDMGHAGTKRDLQIDSPATTPMPYQQRLHTASAPCYEDPLHRIPLACPLPAQDLTAHPPTHLDGVWGARVVQEGGLPPLEGRPKLAGVVSKAIRPPDVIRGAVVEEVEGGRARGGAREGVEANRKGRPGRSGAAGSAFYLLP